MVRCASGLRDLGVGKGDTVVIYMPMVPQAVVAMLACARLGAICLRMPMPPGTLPTLWGDDERYVSSYLSAHPGTTSPVTAGWWTATATCTSWAAPTTC